MSIEINRREVLRYLSYKNSEIPAEVDELIDSCIDEVVEKSNPKYIYRVFELEGLHLANTDLVFESEDVKKLLDTSHSCALIGATLGMDLDSLIRRYSISDLVRAVVIDAACSVAIEAICDEVERLLQAEHPNAYLTDRFSPGYGDLSIDYQRDISNILNLERSIGVKLSQSGIMIPRKSVTAIIGISNVEQERRESCENCANENCEYRTGKGCGAFE